jgi:hypothetical protein
MIFFLKNYDLNFLKSIYDLNFNALFKLNHTLKPYK